MNMRTRELVPVREYTPNSVAEMLAHAAALRRKAFAPPAVRIPDPEGRLPPAALIEEARSRRPAVIDPDAAAEAAALEDRRLKAEREAFRPQVPDMTAFERTPKQLLRLVADYSGFKVGDVVGPRRQKDLVKARQQAMGALYLTFPHLSLPAIGRIMGGKDHTTVLHACRKIGAYPRGNWPDELLWLRFKLMEQERPKAPAQEEPAFVQGGA